MRFDLGVLALLNERIRITLVFRCIGLQNLGDPFMIYAIELKNSLLLSMEGNCMPGL
jgi:hypothetical protein